MSFGVAAVLVFLSICWSGRGRGAGERTVLGLNCSFRVDDVWPQHTIGSLRAFLRSCSFLDQNTRLISFLVLFYDPVFSLVREDLFLFFSSSWVNLVSSSLQVESIATLQFDCQFSVWITVPNLAWAHNWPRSASLWSWRTAVGGRMPKTSQGNIKFMVMQKLLPRVDHMLPGRTDNDIPDEKGNSWQILSVIKVTWFRLSGDELQ